jgi:hypothetical protein
MKRENGLSKNDGLNRRTFVKGSAGAAIAAGLLHSLSLPVLGEKFVTRLRHGNDLRLSTVRRAV